jgi:putative spermidine/putrescine transport system permease protein
VGAFQTEEGHFTWSNVGDVFDQQYLSAYWTTIELSLVTAAAGGLLGLLMAYAALSPGVPRFLRPLLTTFSGVAANFAGVPLAFAFIATLGTTGLVTRLLQDAGISLYEDGFSLFGFTGLSLAYIYFQVPLMILVIAPAVDGLRREWREAAASLGGSARDYWRHVGLPILAPSILGAMVLLFGNAFSAYATAYALTSGHVELVPLLIGNLIGGNVLSDPHVAYALALGMIVVIAGSMAVYAVLERRAARWRR